MVAVNPQIPEQNAPFYLRLSEPSTVEASKTAGVALEGAANIFDTAIKGADFATKSPIQDTIEKAVNTDRPQFLGALEQVAGIPTDKRIPVSTVSSSQQPSDLISGAAPIIPSTLQQGVQQMGTLAQANQQGKFRNTDYVGRMASLMQDMKSQHPGYGDYIDQQFEQKTGMNVTNKYMADLLQTINERMGNQKSAMVRGLNVLKEGEVQDMPGLAGYIDKVARGDTNGEDPEAYAIKATSQWRGAIANFKKRELERKDDDASATDSLAKLTHDVQGVVTANLFGQNMTFEQLKQYAADYEQGKYKKDTNTETQMGIAAQSILENAYQTVYQKASQSIVAGHRPITGTLGDVDAKNKIMAGLEPLKNFVDHVTKGDYATAASTAKEISDIGNNALRDMNNGLFGGDIAVYARMQTAFAKQGPGAGVEILKKFATNSKLFSEGVDTAIDVMKKQIVTEQAGTNPLTMQEAIDRMRKSGIGKKSEADNGAYDAVTDLPTAVATSTKVDDQTKATVYNATYGPGNEDLLKRFAPDTLKDGKVIQGQDSIFSKLTSQPIVDDAWNLRQRGNTKVWSDLRLSSERNFRDLLGNDIRGLTEQIGTSDKDVQLAYENGQFRTVYGKNFFNSGIPGDLTSRSFAQARSQSIDFTVAKINSALDSMTRIIKKEGGDPELYLKNLLGAEGGNVANGFLEGRDNAFVALAKSLGNGIASAGEVVKKGVTAERDFGTEGVSTNAKEYQNTLTVGNMPHKLEDYTKETPTAASEGQVKGAANAAFPSKEWGNPVDPGFRPEHLTDIKSPTGQNVTVNKASAEAFQGFLKDLSDTGYKIDRVEGYNLREKRTPFGVGGISQHSYGNALDINPDKNMHGMSGDLPPNVSEIAAKHGISWGGDWSSKYRDPMHFEFTGITPKSKYASYRENK